MSTSLNPLNPPRRAAGKRCPCLAMVLLCGSVSLSLGICFNCRNKEREKASVADLFRIARELGEWGASLRSSGYRRAADDWECEARIVTRQARQRLTAEKALETRP